MPRDQSQPSAANVKKSLQGASFPVNRKQLVATAQGNGAPPEVLKVLRKLPSGPYDGLPSVVQALTQHQGPPEAQAGNGKVARKAAARKPARSDQMAPVPSPQVADHPPDITGQARGATQELSEAAERVQAALQQGRQSLLEAKQELEQVSRDLERSRRRLHQPVDGRSHVAHEPEPSVPEASPEPARQDAVADISTLVPAEEAGDRLARYLNDAWAVEKALVDSLQVMADEVQEPGLSAFLEEHRDVTHRQQENLEARLQALGKAPSGGKGFFDQMLARIWDAMSPPRDALDRTLHDLMKGLGTEHFEIAMYQVLTAVARAAGDEETARLAGDHLRQEQEAAERLHQFLAPVAGRVARVPEPS